MNKKRCISTDQRSAEAKAAARLQSEKRQEIFRDFWALDMDQYQKEKHARKIPVERGRIELERKRKLNQLRITLRKLTDGDEFLTDEELDTAFQDFDQLIRIARLQDEEIAYLARFRSDWERIEETDPDRLYELWGDSQWPRAQAIVARWRAETPSKSRWEIKRQHYKLDGRLIERQFGGEWRWEPSCLDEILAGKGVNMATLQKLFGLGRNRFPRVLPKDKQDRQILYRYQAVTKIMDWLLSEPLPSPKKGKRGGSTREIWLADPATRARVLQGVEKRALAVAESPEVKKAFTEVVRRHMPDSAK